MIYHSGLDSPSPGVPALSQTAWHIGLMSGTSMDGIDAALLRTDGVTLAAFGPALTLPYELALRLRIRACLNEGAGKQGGGDAPALSRDLAAAHAVAVQVLLDQAGLAAADIAWLGFHGHTLLHRPAAGRTWQTGDGALLAKLTGIDVVADFRSADVAMGGQGAPLVPLYHSALARYTQLPPPLLVLNLGGVGNVTYIGGEREADLIAFDTGPGNALIDDWMQQRTGKPQDEGGAMAAKGQVQADRLARLLDHAYFSAPPPKSLDRNDFTAQAVEGLSTEDGAATLAAFTAASVARGLGHLPQRPLRCLVCGGGRHNATLMKLLTRHLDMPVEAVEAVGWNGDHLEAEAFAYLAARAVRGLPLSLPGTTGVRLPVSGGRLYRA
ncbi:MAG: anhydro-N-acetylmuramic acid kinase [Ferrovibrio sp.]|uniref:anhydro-N-acetylmuramic acid kinase n=1 Tax=Ferrovibrio sp. TaxID=1917215 RepID=UPI00261E271E|nr:anhydro-N-acetylmuramic acid kinase [Ferrovibrio sp.]MCW0235734.1 anhydro-N-acetylmuramic acid kinase [Ferrovibrio sp.]